MVTHASDSSEQPAIEGDILAALATELVVQARQRR